MKGTLLAGPRGLSGPPGQGQVCWGCCQPGLQWAWQRQEYYTNVPLLPHSRSWSPDGPGDSKVPNQSLNGGTFFWLRPSRQAMSQRVTTRGLGRT